MLLLLVGNIIYNSCSETAGIVKASSTMPRSIRGYQDTMIFCMSRDTLHSSINAVLLLDSNGRSKSYNEAKSKGT
jgi:hypothetical protein